MNLDDLWTDRMVPNKFGQRFVTGDDWRRGCVDAKRLGHEIITIGRDDDLVLRVGEDLREHRIAERGLPTSDLALQVVEPSPPRPRFVRAKTCEYDATGSVTSKPLMPRCTAVAQLPGSVEFRSWSESSARSIASQWTTISSPVLIPDWRDAPESSTKSRELSRNLFVSA